LSVPWCTPGRQVIAKGDEFELGGG